MASQRPIRHPRPPQDSSPAKYEKGAKVLVNEYRCTICSVWWDGEGWRYEVEGAPNGPYRGRWIFQESSLMDGEKGAK